MPATEAQILANRRNAARSCGPKTAEGKAVSRFNAVRHGLRAESATLPGDDADHVKARFVNLHKELRPADAIGEAWVDQIALQSIRLERCQRFDAAHYSKRVEEAREAFDKAREAKLDALVDRLETEGSRALPEIEAMPEGVAWLLFEWSEILDDLNRPEGAVWGPGHLETIRRLLGAEPSAAIVHRGRILTQILGKSTANAGQIGAPEGLDAEGLAEWARLELATIAEAETARLEAVQAAIDPKVLERQRSDAEALALFDPSKEATLARKYEAATQRALYKAIEEFRESQKPKRASMDAAANDLIDQTCDELGSFDQNSEPESEPAPPPTPRIESQPPKFERGMIRTPEERKKRPNPAKLRRR